MSVPNAQVPAYRKEIRQNTLKKVARLLSDYYQAIEQQINQADLKKETFDTVKEMDLIAGQDARDENDYTAIMTNQFNMFQEHLNCKKKEITSGTDPVMMATVMINSLQSLQDFIEHTEFQKHDEQLIQQLIQFIKSIPSNNFGVQIAKKEQIEAVKLYYEKLFIPIQKTMEKQNPNQMVQPQQQAPTPNAQVTGAQQQMMQQMLQAQQGIQPQMQQLQRPQMTPSMMQQMSPTQDLNGMQRPMPTPPSRIMNPLQQQQQTQPPPQPGIPVQPQPQGQQIPQQIQQIQQQQSVQQIPQQPSVQQLQQQPSVQQLQQVQQHNPRSPQQKPRSPRSIPSASPQMMQMVQQQQPMHAMNMPMNPQQPPQQPNQGRAPIQRSPDAPPASNTEILRQLFSSVRADCAVFYSTPHPPHF